jgi:DNA mismatch repair protein MutL
MRILFDKLINKSQTSSNNSNMLMFPETINFSVTDARLMSEISDELNKCGFVISYLGKEMFSVSAVPENIDLRGLKIDQILESVLEDYKSSGLVKNNRNDAVILSMARKLSLKHGDFLNREMMQLLISELFASSNPEVAPDGKRIYSIVNVDNLSKWL